MKTNRLPCNLNRVFTLLLSAGLLTSLPAHATLTTNSWASFFSGPWQGGSLWSLGVPPSSSQSIVTITNSFVTGTSKTITIDGTTATNFPATMTVSNLAVLGSLALGNVPPLGNNILALSSAANVPLTVLNSLVVSNGGIISISNSILNTGGNELIGALGTMFLSSGTNNIADNLVIGDGANAAALWMNGGELNAAALTINNGALLVQSNGTANIYGAECVVFGNWALAGGTQNGTLIVGNGGTPGTGTMTGGQLLGGLGINRGTMVVSNGQVNLNDATVGSPANSDGTLTVAGGTVTFESLQIGGGTGTLWITGGSLQITNNYLYDGTGNGVASGTLIQSNGTMALFGELVGSPFISGPFPDGTLTVDRRRPYNWRRRIGRGIWKGPEPSG